MPHPDQLPLTTASSLRRRPRPRRGTGLLLATALAVGLLFGAAPTASAGRSSGPVTTWGYPPSIGSPASLGTTGATAIAAGDYHGLALTPAGKVVAWGDDSYGQTDVPASLAAERVTAITAGGGQSLALTSDGRVTAWGENDFGQGDVPASLSGRTVTAIAAGALHDLALTSDGRVTAWGYDDGGATRVPASLTGKRVTAISAGAQYDLALTSDGRVTAWGWNLSGVTDVPAALSHTRVVAISAGESFALALTSDGQIIAWGDHEYGQTQVPASLSGKRVTAISAGKFHSLALTSDGQVTAWGRNDYGEARISASLSGKTVTAVAAGFLWSMALTQGAAPSAGDLEVRAGFESATPVALVGTDPAGHPLTYTVLDPPAHGTLTGTAPALTYTPDDGYSGADSFTYRVDDGRLSSPVARVSVTVSPPSCVPRTPRRELRVSTGERDRDGVVRSPRFTTTKSGELLVAFVAVNRPAAGVQAVTGVDGGGLRWTLVQRGSTRTGSSEIWQAYSARKLGSTRISAHLAAPGSSATLTVAGFSGARTSVGSAAHRSGARSAPRVTLAPHASGSVVWAVGRVIGSRYDPRPVSGQRIVHARTFRSPTSGSWVQRTTRAVTVGRDVTVGDRATARTWGYAAVEIRGTCG